MIILILFTAFAASGKLEATEAAKEGNFREIRIDMYVVGIKLGWFVPKSTTYIYLTCTYCI